MIVCKKNIVNRRGEREQLNVYSSAIECKLTGEPHKTIKRGGKTLGYVGLTRDLDTPKASSKRVKIKDKVYAERKYLGRTSFNAWAQNNLTDYKTIERITELPDTSDGTTHRTMFENCVNLKEVVPEIDCRNSENIDGMCYNCPSLEKPLKLKNLNKVKNVVNLYINCSKLTEESDLTSLTSCEEYTNMYRRTSITTINKINTSSGKYFGDMLAATKIKECTSLDLSNAIDINRILEMSTVEVVDNFNTKNVTFFEAAFWNCQQLRQVCPISFKSLTADNILQKIGSMLQYCNSLPTITFIDVPQGITVEQIRSATKAPDTCEIILNYRNE